MQFYLNKLQCLIRHTQTVAAGQVTSPQENDDRPSLIPARIQDETIEYKTNEEIEIR